MYDKIVEKAYRLPPITLGEMSGIKLMNRTDTKFVATFEQLCSFLSSVEGKYYIQDINGQRLASYHTTYFDTDDYQMYVMHHQGKTTREKIRVRTYLDSNDTFLEVKNKNNHGRTKKKRIHLNGADTYVQDGAAEFLASHTMLPLTLSDITPKLSNHFTRITLVNNAKTERLTIDRELSFHNEVTGLDRSMDNLVVIEVKRDGNTYSPIQELLRQVRIFPCGFSKYCIGMALTTPGLKRNLFNERIRKIEKLTSICY